MVNIFRIKSNEDDVKPPVIEEISKDDPHYIEPSHKSVEKINLDAKPPVKEPIPKEEINPKVEEIDNNEQQELKKSYFLDNQSLANRQRLERSIEVINTNDSKNGEYKSFIDFDGNPIPRNSDTGQGVVYAGISPGTEELTHPAQSYQLSSEDKRMLIALVYAEATENNRYMISDSMGVTSVVLNRLESPNHKGNTISEIITSDKQFEGYKSDKYIEAYNNPSVVNPIMVNSIERVLAGERNTYKEFFAGNKVDADGFDYNRFKDTWN